MGFFNQEQEEAAFIDSKIELKKYLAKIPPNTANLFKSIDKKIQKAYNNGINCLFFLVEKKKNVGLFSCGLTEQNKMYEIDSKLEARRNFEIFIPQILQIMDNFGFDCVIRNRLNKITISNFKPDGDDDDNEPWKEKAPN